MAFADNNMIRIATHGKGLSQRAAVAATAAPVSISGRIVDTLGKGIANAVISFVDPEGETHRLPKVKIGFPATSLP